MFNLYQCGNKQKDEEIELNVIGHDRFCQMRPSRSLLRKKKILSKRSKSVTEFSENTLNLAKRKSAIDDSNKPTELSFHSFANLLRKR